MTQPTVIGHVTALSYEPLPWIGILVAAAGYLVAVGLTNRAHPRSPVPPWRIAAWLAGLATIAVALLSPVDEYADALLSVHMIQHLLLMMVAPPLLALGAPMTLLLRASRPQVRRRWLLPVLHSRLVAAVSWPPVGWLLFGATMWATHFTPVFEAALEDPGVHQLEHLAYLLAGCLFWWPVIGADPARWRLRPFWRVSYLAAQMPLSAAVGLAIYFAPVVLYPHYLAVERTWGPDPLTDQQVAGIIMWGVGDTIMLGAVVLSIAAWLRAEERRARRLASRLAHNDAGQAVDLGIPVRGG